MSYLTVHHPARRPPRHHVSLAVWICLVGAVVPCPARGEERSTWWALPEETLFAARIPGGTAFLKALRERTKLGAVVFSEERFDQVVLLMEQHDSEGWEALVDGLENYGLTPGDMTALLGGESGAAVLLDRDEDLGNLPVGVAWVDPGEDLATRTFEAVARAVDDAEGEQEPPQRFDLELEQCPVMHLRVPEYEAAFDLELPDNFDRMTDEERQQFWDDWMNREGDEAPSELSGYGNVLLARMGGRLVVITSFDVEPLEAATVTGERLTSVMARCLAAHRDQSAGFVAAVEAAEGVAEALPEGGIGGFEMFVDIGGLVALADETPEVAGVLETFGFRGLGIAAMSIALDGNVLRSGTLLQAPSPRTGLVKLLEQPPLEPAPPAWVPRQLLSYAHLSFDLGAAYELIKATVLKVEPNAGQVFVMAESWAFGFAQADLAAILSAFGHKHMLMQFAPSAPEGEVESSLDRFDTMQRFAIVWQLKDAAVIQRLIESALGMMQGTPVETVEEQGFRGWRVDQHGGHAGVMIGKGYMVATSGEGVMETVLAALNHPLQGADAMRTSPLFAVAAEMSKLEPGLLFQVTDGDRSALSTHAMITTALKQAIAGFSDPEMVGDEGESLATLLSQIQDLLPTEEEWRGAVGVGSGCGIVNEDGLILRAASMLPAP